MNKELVNTTIPCLILDEDLNVIWWNDNFKQQVYSGVKLNIPLHAQFLAECPSRTFSEQLENFVNSIKINNNNFLLTHIWFIPKSIIMLERQVQVIEFWYLQIFKCGQETYILFHSENHTSNTSRIFANILNIFKNADNPISIQPYKDFNKSFKRSFKNAVFYSSIMPHIAFEKFYFMSDKVYLENFDYTAKCPRLEIDNQINDICKRQMGRAEFRKKYIKGNFIPFASCESPFILSLGDDY